MSELQNNWTRQKREQIASKIRSEISTIDALVTQTKRRVLWKAPCFREWAWKRLDREQLLEFVLNASTRFLEDNRSNYKDYIEVSEG